MPDRKFQRIDFSDVTRHGAHTAEYVDGEKVEWLTYFAHPSRPGYQMKCGLNAHGDSNLLVCSPWNIGSYYACVGFIGEIMPQYFTTECKAFNADGGGGGYNYATFFGFADFDFIAYKTYTGEEAGASGPNPVQFCANFDGNYYKFGIRSAGGALSKYAYDTAPIVVPGYFRFLTHKRQTGIGMAMFKANGEFVNCVFNPAATIYEFNKLAKFYICGGHTWHVGYSGLLWLKASEYKHIDIMDERDSGDVATTGTIEGGAANAYDAIHDASETTRVVLHTGEYLEIQLADSPYDAPLYEIRIVTDATAANFLSAKVATQAMGALWSVSVPLGDTTKTRCDDEILSGMTIKCRHLYYPEIEGLCGLSETETPGCCKVRFENNNASDIKIYRVEVIQSCDEITLANDNVTPGPRVSVSLTGIDCPIGATGPTQTVNVKNTSETDTASCYVKMVNDGFYDPAIAIVEYSADEVTWYDKLNPPPGADGIQIGPVVPEGLMPFYVRTKLPSSGQLFQRFSAQFTIKLTNV